MKIGLLSAIAVAIFMFGGVAQAAPVAPPITGSVSGTLGALSTDTYGLFSAPGTDLSGMSFNYSFSYDPASLNTTNQPNEVYKYANTNNGAIFASISINGTEYDPSYASAGAQSWARLGNAGATFPNNGTFFQMNTFDNSGNEFVFNFFPAFSVSLSDITSQSAIDAIVHGEGTVATVLFAFTDSRVESFNVNVGASPTPEPGSLTLLGTGLCLLGLRLRRKN